MKPVVLRGDARCLPLPDASVDLIVTSPPYFGLRSYTDTVKCLKCIDMERDGRDPRQAWPDYAAHVERDHVQHYDGQIGSEATPAEWLAALIECTAEWVRVLKPQGSLFVNLGDKYAQSAAQWGGSRRGHQGALAGTKADEAARFGQACAGGAPAMGTPKSLLGLPWRYAIACTDQLGLILRRDIIWNKPNGLPESVTDRCRSSHEYVFHLVRQPRYYAAVDAIREEHDPDSFRASKHGRNGLGAGGILGRDVNLPRSSTGPYAGPNPLGKLPGSVWSIPSQPLTVPAHLGIDHFAAFPMELPRRLILGWSPSGVCTGCGEGRRPVAERTGRIVSSHGDRLLGGSGTAYAVGGSSQTTPVRAASGWHLPKHEQVITGYACACPQPTAPTRPSVVVDPFGGTGTTALVAAMHGRLGITIDRSADYSRLAAWRTQDPAQRAAAMQVPKPPPVPDGMEPLFTL